MKRHQQTRHALGSDAVLTLVLADNLQPAAIFDALWQQIETFGQRFSRFLPDSELSRFNAAAGSEQPISSEFHKLLAAAKSYGENTDGLYNPCILPALQHAGYRGSWPTPQTVDDHLNYEDRGVAHWSDITIGDTWMRIPADAALDFGGIGKGYLLEQLGETLATKHISNYWLSLGGDILCNGHNANGDSWYIGITHALRDNKTVAAIKNHGRKLAVATSGITKRRGISAAGKWHHIIDPRTGRPASTTVLTATVAMDNATAADIAATCFVVSPETPVLGVANYILQTPHGADVTVEKAGELWA